MRERLLHLYDKISGALRTNKGRNVLIYLMFVCVAFVFWYFMSLDSEVQRNYDIPIRVENLPDSITVIHDFPRSVSVTVQAKGAQLVRFMWSDPSPLKIQFEPSDRQNGVFTVPPQKFETRLRDYFGAAVNIVTARPDSLAMTYTTAPGRRVALKVLASVEPDLQSIVSGMPTADVDSVTVYALGEVPASLESVSTELLKHTGLTDTTRFEVGVQAPEGMRVIPDRVTVTVPVEPLVSKRCKVELEVANLPHGTRMLLFPSSVEVNYLVPMSRIREEYPIRAYASYYEAAKAHGGKVSVQLGPIPGRYYSISHTPDSVEFIIEHE